MSIFDLSLLEAKNILLPKNLRKIITSLQMIFYNKKR